MNTKTDKALCDDLTAAVFEECARNSAGGTEFILRLGSTRPLLNAATGNHGECISPWAQSCGNRT
jgi:hypothetical protein